VLVGVGQRREPCPEVPCGIVVRGAHGGARVPLVWAGCRDGRPRIALPGRPPRT
jgi:hypothetical protein